MIWLGIGVTIGLFIAAIIIIILFVHYFGNMWNP